MKKKTLICNHVIFVYRPKILSNVYIHRKIYNEKKIIVVGNIFSILMCLCSVSIIFMITNEHIITRCIGKAKKLRHHIIEGVVYHIAFL